MTGIRRLALASALVAVALAGCSKGADSEVKKVREAQKQGDLPAVAQAAAEADTTVARAAVEALGRMGPRAVPHIEKAMRDQREPIRETAALAYAQAAPQEQLGNLSAVAREDPSPMVRATAVNALGQAYAFNEIDTLSAAIEDPDRAVRVRAQAALTRLIGHRYETHIDGTPAQRHQVAVGLRQAWPAMSKPVQENLKQVLEHKGAKP